MVTIILNPLVKEQIIKHIVGKWR